MFFLKAQKSYKFIFNYKIENLCIGIFYELSAYFANAFKKSSWKAESNICFEVQRVKKDSALIATNTTGGVPQYSKMTRSKNRLLINAPNSSVVL